jgi:hypothetical protein
LPFQKVEILHFVQNDKKIGSAMTFWGAQAEMGSKPAFPSSAWGRGLSKGEIYHALCGVIHGTIENYCRCIAEFAEMIENILNSWLYYLKK